MKERKEDPCSQTYQPSYRLYLLEEEMKANTLLLSKSLKFNEPNRFKREERKIGCIRGGQCKLNEIFHEEECMLLEHSCGSKMKLVLIGTIYTNESWKCSMQCKCINGYIEISGGCSEITNNYVSTKNFLFLV